MNVKGADSDYHLSSEIDNLLPDGILIDIQLGFADGGKICQELKQPYKTKHIPVILISASDSQMMECGISANQNVFVSKPFDIVNMINLVNSQFKPLIN